MTTVTDLIEVLDALDVPFEAAEAIEHTKENIIDLQKDQMIHGKSSTGDKIGNYKNKYYRRKKFDMNPLAGYGIADLKLTGEFYRNFNVRVFRDVYLIESTDSKNKLLQEKYGDEIFGLTDRNQNEYVDSVLKDQFLKQMHEKTGL